MADDRRRDGSKRSFSEQDKRRRERHGRRDGDGERGSRHGHAHSQKAYRAALERAFESGKVEELAATLSRVPAPRSPDRTAPPAASPAPPDAAAAANPEPKPGSAPRAGKPPPSKRPQLLAKIRSAEGGVEITAAVDRFLAEFPDLPNDFEVLEKALSHRKSEVVRRALDQLEAALARTKPRRNRSLLMKLALLEENHDDDEICALAARIRTTL